MANELRHKDAVAGRVRENEYEDIQQHILNGQATGDIVYASSAAQLKGLAIGATNTVLQVVGGIPTWVAAPIIGDDALLSVGDDQDGVIVLVSAGIAADTNLAGVLVGASQDTSALAANSLIISNITTDGDILIAASDGGHSRQALFVDGSTGIIHIGRPSVSGQAVGTGGVVFGGAIEFNNTLYVEGQVYHFVGTRYADDVEAGFGANGDGDVTMRYETADPDALIFTILMDESKNSGNNIPVFAFAEGTTLGDLGWFDGYVEPALAVLNIAKDAFVSLDAGDINGATPGVGLYFKAAADEDINILKLSVTDTPNEIWDESRDIFDRSKGQRFQGSLFLTEKAAADTDEPGDGQLWVKDDAPNNLYFTDDAGNDRQIALFDADTGEMIVTSNQTATIETADIPHAFTGFSTGDVQDFSFVAGITGAITAYADYSGTVANAILATCVGHGLVTNDIITIRGTTAPNDYNGIWQITRVDDDNFYFVEAALWNADAGASDFEMGDYLLAGTGTAGEYDIGWNSSVSEGGGAGSVVLFCPMQNTTILTKASAKRKFANNDVGSISGGGHIAIAVADRIWFTHQSDGTQDLTVNLMNLRLARLA